MNMPRNAVGGKCGCVSCRGNTPDGAGSRASWTGQKNKRGGNYGKGPGSKKGHGKGSR